MSRAAGKIIAARVLMGLYEPSGGKVLFEGKDIHGAKGAVVRALNRRVQMIFQDPQASLNPRMVVSDIIAESVDIHGLAGARRSASTVCTSFWGLRACTGGTLAATRTSSRAASVRGSA